MFIILKEKDKSISISVISFVLDSKETKSNMSIKWLLSPGGICKKGFLKNFAKFTGKHLCQSLFFNIKKETLAQVFSCEFCEISKKSFFYGTPPVAASEAIAIDIIGNVWLAVFVISHTWIEWIFNPKKCLSIHLQTDSSSGLESHYSHFDNVCSGYLINTLSIDLG